MTGKLSHEQPISGKWVLIQIGILAVLSVLVFRSQLQFILPRFVEDSEAAHALAVPFLILFLALRRRERILNALAPGSPWGLVVMIGAMLLYAIATWPFNYGYPRYLAILVAIAGALLATGGWRVLRLCSPMLLILLLALPIGHRQYAGLIVRPETVTLQAAERILSFLPGVSMRLDGADLYYTARGGSGVIGLGDPHRGASLFLSFLTLGMFVTFLRIRPMWQIAIVGALALPIALLSNLVRVLLHGGITIAGNFTPLSPVPRTLSAALALIFAYLAFIVLLWVLQSAVVPVDDEPNDEDERSESA